jgi:RNA polymerase sigma-70 factor, ECF subfamily
MFADDDLPTVLTAAAHPALLAFWQQAIKAWPTLINAHSDSVIQAAFWTSVATHLHSDHKIAALGRLRSDDIFIAVAVVSGDTAAWELFDRTFIRTQRGALARLGLDADGIDDAMQILREDMTLPKHGKPPQILTLAGPGNLAHVLRVVAVRIGLKQRRSAQYLEPVQDDSVFDQLLGPLGLSNSPIQSLIKQEAATILRAAIATAMTELPARERNILRLHFRDRLSIDELGRIYDVHRATAARWLNSIYATIQASARNHLLTHHGSSAPSLSSVFEQASSQLQISFARLMTQADLNDKA